MRQFKILKAHFSKLMAFFSLTLKVSFFIKMLRKQKSKNITLDDLDRMINKGFEETAKKVDMDIQFGEVNERLDKIEKILFWDYKNRIEKLEGEIKELQADFRQLIGIKK